MNRGTLERSMIQTSQSQINRPAVLEGKTFNKPYFKPGQGLCTATRV